MIEGQFPAKTLSSRNQAQSLAMRTWVATSLNIRVAQSRKSISIAITDMGHSCITIKAIWERKSSKCQFRARVKKAMWLTPSRATATLEQNEGSPQ